MIVQDAQGHERGGQPPWSCCISYWTATRWPAGGRTTESMPLSRSSSPLRAPLGQIFRDSHRRSSWSCFSRVRFAPKSWQAFANSPGQILSHPSHSCLPVRCSGVSLSVPSLIRNRKGSIPIGNLCILEQSLPICVQVFQFSVPSTGLWFDHPDWDWSSPVQEGNRRFRTMGIPLFGRNVTRLSTSTGCRGIWCIHQVCPSVASTI